MQTLGLEHPRSALDLSSKAAGTKLLKQNRKTKLKRLFTQLMQDGVKRDAFSIQRDSTLYLYGVKVYKECIITA